MNPTPPNRRVLVIDDNLAIHDDFRKILGGTAATRTDLLAARAELFGDAPAAAGLAGFDVDFADQGEAGLAKVRQARADGAPFAMAFVDMRMPPGWDGVETIGHLWAAEPDLQVVICTAFTDHSWDHVIESLGQTDRLLILRKPFDSIEAWQLANALTAKWSLQEAARAQRGELEEKVTERTRTLTQAMQLLKEKVEERQQAVAQAEAARAHAEAIKQKLFAINVILEAEAEQRSRREAELLRLTENLQKEIAARRRAEQQFLQSQKLEAIGRLAGGVAHDFNNLLTVIICSSETLLSPTHRSAGSHDTVEQIRKAAERAAGLTRQLLAFSRQEIAAPVALNLNAVITDAEKMFRRVVRENIHLHLRLDPVAQTVTADPGQLEQVLMNLIVNASDAMPDGGQLTIATGPAGPEAARIQANPGPFVRLAVGDTGCGMDEHTKARIFEPFFTTKERGKGTGLGLATVFGIVREAGGWVEVDSAPGLGSTFQVYLPQGEAGDQPAAAPEAAVESAPAPQRSTETVLLVEDEEILREIIQMALEDRGYTVLAAADGEAAIRLCEAHPGPIHLLITDLVMPGMSGRQVSESVTTRRSGIPVLFMSGYTDDEQVRSGVRNTGQAFIQKPFTSATLAHKLQDVLGCQSTRPPAECGSLS
jgi:signal transduction histidine kinase